MALVPEIDRLLDMDVDNVREVRRFLSNDAPDSLEIMNQAAVNYTTATRAFGQGIEDPWTELSEKMGALSVTDIPQLLVLLDGPVPKGHSRLFAEASEALDRHFSLENRSMLLARLGVLYGTAVADFMRMRVTAPLGYMRVQCESLALMKLMCDDPSIAREWRFIKSHADGRAFFGRHQGSVKATLRRFELEFAYNNASSTALHSRFAGMVLGLRTSTSAGGSRITQRIEVVAQELHPDNPDLFILMLFHCFRVQERILRHLSQACPEISDRLFLETRVPQFSRLVEQLYQNFVKRRPDLARQYFDAEDSA